MADGELVTERLILRPPVQDDLPWLLAEMNTLPVLRHLGGKLRPDRAVAESLAEDIAAFCSGGHQRWTVLLRGGETRVGRCGLSRVRSPAAPPPLRGQPEIGWSFAAPHWGKGYATEAARAVLAHAFGARGLPVIYSQTSNSNAASTRMMQRLGFTRRAELGYFDPDYPPEDNPTTVWSLHATCG